LKPLSTWIIAIYLIKSGMSALELKRQLGVSYATVFPLHCKINRQLGTQDATHQFSPASSHVTRTASIGSTQPRFISRQLRAKRAFCSLARSMHNLSPLITLCAESYVVALYLSS
jgi:DNA-binding CsgD family transcriptional regulator